MAWSVECPKVVQHHRNQAPEPTGPPKQARVPDGLWPHAPQPATKGADTDLVQQRTGAGIESKLVMDLQQPRQLDQERFEPFRTDIARGLPNQGQAIAEALAVVAPGPRPAHRLTDPLAASQHFDGVFAAVARGSAEAVEDFASAVSSRHPILLR